MLLSIVSILIGAIVVPREYSWLYSTHIIILCLYLIRYHRFLSLILVLISFTSIVINGFYSANSSWRPNTGLLVYVNLKEKVLYTDPLPTQPIFGKAKATLVLTMPDGERQRITNVSIKAIPSFRGETPFSEQGEGKKAVPMLVGKVSSFMLPNKQGGWVERQLYIDHQIVRLSLQDVHWLSYKANQASHHNSSMVIEKNLLRQQINAYFDKRFADFASWRFTKALLLGNSDDWSERDKWLVRVLGLAHLFVVSGLHTGFVYGFGRLLSRGTWRLMPESLLLSGKMTTWRLDALLIIPLLFAYAYLTNWGAPVVRAGIMLSLYLLTRASVVRLSPYKTVGFALWLILLIDPRSVLEPGLWLSFSLVCLLIGFVQGERKWSRLLVMQIMFSTASSVLILGWQSDVSAATIVINIIMIPFAAFVWFPGAIIACLACCLFNSLYCYALLDSLLEPVIHGLEVVAFHWPLLSFELVFSDLLKVFLLGILAFWVWQTPLKRGWFGVVAIWGVLLLPRGFFAGTPLLTVWHVGSYLVAKRGGELLMSDHWHDKVSSQFIDPWISDSKSTPRILLPNAYKKTLSANSLIKNHIDWVLLKKVPSKTMLARLSALQVKWIVVPIDERLQFRKVNHHIYVWHQACSFAFFLFKSDTCKRVETLEFVLN
ncbi:ComEC/Rec2 family competence protein [Marinomonas spartinae]|uniref:ComEC/Rec2 family competence protein n=1 Tax=Marinomonas spartinae TaxID=1792290 RepID=UPI0018F1F17F|nr:ComEC/Rec2 family competence protein [Marinomonas spartinae]MBJ7554123.1 ComEC/Rec2 family competence protein [Marinomonas spartinae]